jgi:hypothetical protein
VNSDGYADWLAIAGSGRLDRAHLFFGGPEAPTGLDGCAQIDKVSVESGDGGFVAQGVGDMNGDGVDDLAFSDSWDTAAWILYGPISGDVALAGADSVLDDPQGTPGWYGGLHGGDDLDGDGHPDLLVGYGSSAAEGEDAGLVFVVSGPFGASQDLRDAGAILEGTWDNGFAGASLGAAGDLDGDGFMELIIGAHSDGTGTSSSGGYGAVFIVPGPTAGHRFLYEAGLRLEGSSGDSNGVGFSIDVGHDLDGDGVDDMVVGAPSSNSDAGAVYLLPGAIFAGGVL